MLEIIKHRTSVVSDKRDNISHRAVIRYLGLKGSTPKEIHGAMGRRIDPSWGGPIELFLVPTSVPRMV